MIYIFCDYGIFHLRFTIYVRAKLIYYFLYYKLYF